MIDDDGTTETDDNDYFKLNTTQGSLITGKPYHLRNFHGIKGME